MCHLVVLPAVGRLTDSVKSWGDIDIAPSIARSHHFARHFVSITTH